MTAVERFCREVGVDFGTLRNGERKDDRTQNYLGCWWKNAYSRYQLHTHTAYDVPRNGRGGGRHHQVAGLRTLACRALAGPLHVRCVCAHRVERHIVWLGNACLVSDY